MYQHENKRLKKNNFDLLRVLFALMVCLVHVFELSGFRQLSWIIVIFSSEIAVKSFFVISGFLIFMSYERSSSLKSYVSKRFRRIYPAYFTVVVICSSSFVAISTVGGEDYFSLEWFQYVAANLSFLNFLHPTLPGVFESNRMSSVNGSLWTLKIEVMFYMVVPLLGYLFRRFSRLGVMIVVYCVSVLYSELLLSAAERTGFVFYETLSRQLPGQLSYFISGAFLYYFFSFFQRQAFYIVIGSTLVLIVDQVISLSVFEPFALGVMVIFFGLYIYVGNFGKYGDFSYGIYIIHFPIIQYFLYLGWFKGQPWYFLSSVIFITIVGSIAMWHMVEKRFLLRSSHYIDAAEGAAEHVK